MLPSVSAHAESDLHAAHHDHELVEGEDLNVYMDIAHMGVGGHDAWSPSVEPEYVVRPGRFSWSMSIGALAPGEDAAAAAAARWDARV